MKVSKATGACLAGVVVASGFLAAAPVQAQSASPAPGGVGVAASHVQPSHKKPKQSKLRILLTNDDSYKAPGINAVYQALRAAGYDATIFAPLVNQSGAASTQTFGTLTVTQPVAGDPNIFAISGTPADTVALALETRFRDNRPDLIISGCNKGENLGAWGVNLSGTVGAAATAGVYGVPAIACSTEEDFTDANAAPPNFAGSAEFITSLVKHLDKNRSDLRSLRHHGINVNYPYLTAGEKLKGVAWAAPEPVTNYHPTYTASADDPNVYTAGFGSAASPTNRTDYSLLRRNYITMTPMNASFLESSSRFQGLAKSLARVYR